MEARTREVEVVIRPEAKVVINAAQSLISYERPHHNLLRVQLTGKEEPEAGRLFFTLLDLELSYDRRRQLRDRFGPAVHLFVDARRVSQHGLMFESWIRFLLERQLPLRHIHILATNKTIALSVQIIQHLSNTGTLVKLYDNHARFHAAQSTLLPDGMGPVATEVNARRLRKQVQLSRKLVCIVE